MIVWSCKGCPARFSTRGHLAVHWEDSPCRPCGHDDCECRYMDEVEYEELVLSCRQDS